MILQDEAVRGQGVVVRLRYYVEFLSFDPPTRLKAAEGFGQVSRPVTNSATGANTRVDEIKGGFKDPRLVEVVDPELGVG